MAFGDGEDEAGGPRVVKCEWDGADGTVCPRKAQVANGSPDRTVKTWRR